MIPSTSSPLEGARIRLQLLLETMMLMLMVVMLVVRKKIFNMLEQRVGEGSLECTQCSPRPATCHSTGLDCRGKRLHVSLSCSGEIRFCICAYNVWCGWSGMDVHGDACACVLVWVWAWVWVGVCVYIYIYIYICVCVCVCQALLQRDRTGLAFQLQGAPGAWIGQVPIKTPIQCS